MKRPPGPHQESIEVREQVYYEPKFFKVYNHVQERYARRVGFQAWGIYTTLKQFAAWNVAAPRVTVSLARLAITWGCTTRTVKRAIRKLRDFGLIKTKKNQASSTYTILRIPVPRAMRRGDKFVPSQGSKLSLQRGQQSPIELEPLYQEPLYQERGVDTPSKGTHRRPGKDQAPPRFTQKDFDERDYRKWNLEMERSKPPDSVLVGLRAEEYWRRWTQRARDAAAAVGIMPQRLVKLLKQAGRDDEASQVKGKK